MNGAKKLSLLFLVHALPGLSGLMAREPAIQKEVAAAIEAFRKMDEWDIKTFRIPVGCSLFRTGSLEDAAPASASAGIKAALEKQVGDLPDGTIIEVEIAELAS